VFAAPLTRDLRGVRIAWTPDLGFLPVAAAVRAVTAGAPRVFESLGCRVEAAAPDWRDGPEIFQTLRAHLFAASFAGLYRSAPDQLKDTIRWNTERGLALSAEAVGRAELAQTRMYRRTLAFFEHHDLLIAPTTQVAPFAKTIDWVREIDGQAFDNYLQWMESCAIVSLTGCPAISVPCGFTADGLPVGLQIVGPPRADLAVLQAAAAFEQATGHGQRRPTL
jgi:amidase